MKKFMMAVVIAAMACGAWADTSYTFQLNLMNISSGGSGGSTDSTLYFVNKDTHEIYAYFRRSDLETYTEDKSYGGNKIQQTYNNLTLPAGYSESANAAKILDSAGITKTIHADNDQLADVVYKMDFSAAGLPVNKTSKDVSGYWSGPTPELAAILVFDTGATMEYGNFTSKSISDNMVNYQAVFIKAVPEPTSGLLMLLGIAGLALKRRKVA